MLRKLVSLGLATLAVAAVCAPAATTAPHRRGPRLAQNDLTYIVSLATGKVRRVTSRRQDHYDPLLSPSGKLIADSVLVGDSSRPVVEIMTTGGRVVRRLDAGTESTATPPAWSPDSRQIAFLQTYDNRARDASDAWLATTPVTGGPPRRLADLAVDRPAWTPDGRTLLYLRGDVVGTYEVGDPIDYNDSEIWSVASDGRDAHRIVADVGPEPPVLSPDGDRFLFVRWAGDRSELWTARLDGQGERRLYPGGLDQGGWVPGSDEPWLFRAVGDRLRAVVLGAAGASPLPRVRSGPLAWSPDGRRVAWGAGPTIRTMRRDGSHVREVVRFRIDRRNIGFCTSLQWSPDATRLVMSCEQQSHD